MRIIFRILPSQSYLSATNHADAANGPEWYITAFEVPAEGKFKVVSVDAQSQATWYGSDKVDLQEGITNASPVILEPIMTVVVTSPDNYMGDIMGDMNKRRGRILGMETVGRLGRYIC